MGSEIGRLFNRSFFLISPSPPLFLPLPFFLPVSSLVSYCPSLLCPLMGVCLVTLIVRMASWK